MALSPDETYLIAAGGDSNGAILGKLNSSNG